MLSAVHVRSVPRQQWALPVVLAAQPPRPDLAQQPQEPRQEGGQEAPHEEEVHRGQEAHSQARDGEHGGPCQISGLQRINVITICLLTGAGVCRENSQLYCALARIWRSSDANVHLRSWHVDESGDCFDLSWHGRHRGRPDKWITASNETLFSRNVGALN